MFRIDLPAEDFRLIEMAPELAYRAARWVRRFHQTPFSHVGCGDHEIGTPFHEVLEKHGFVRTPRFELNSIRLLLQTYGPLLISGSFSHLAQHESSTLVSETPLVRVSRYEDGDHVLILNGYWDGFEPRLLYRDPSHPHRRFVDEASRLLARCETGAGILYQNCPSFPKPCPHLPNVPLVGPRRGT